MWPTTLLQTVSVPKHSTSSSAERLREVDVLEIPKKEKVETLQVKRSWWCSTDLTCFSMDSDWATFSSSAVCFSYLHPRHSLCHFLACSSICYSKTSVCFYSFGVSVRDILSTVQTYTLCSVFSLHSVSIWMIMFTPAHWMTSKTVTVRFICWF